MSYTPYGIALPTPSIGKSCVFTFRGFFFGRHSRPLFLKFPTNSFFCVDRNRWLLAPYEIRGLVVYEFELVIAIWMLFPFLGLFCRLKTIPVIPQDLCHRPI